MDALGILTEQVNESRFANIMILPDNGATFQDYLDFIKYVRKIEENFYFLLHPSKKCDIIKESWTLSSVG